MYGCGHRSDCVADELQLRYDREGCRLLHLLELRHNLRIHAQFAVPEMWLHDDLDHVTPVRSRAMRGNASPAIVRSRRERFIYPPRMSTQPDTKASANPAPRSAAPDIKTALRFDIRRVGAL